MKPQDLARSLVSKVVTFRRSSGIFAGPLDVLKYIYLKTSPFAFPKRLSIRLKELDRPLVCRPRTTDIGVLLDTFKGGYHRPPGGAGLPANAVIFDLGANVGYTVVDFARRYPDARIIAVEMDGDNFDLALENTRSFGSRCILLHAAVWTEDGEISYEGSGASGYHISGAAKDRTRVAARSLMSIIEQFQVGTIDYLKMDIEGAEREVLEASMEWAASVTVMQVEAHSPEILRIVNEKLTSAGFTCAPSPTHWASVTAVRVGARE